MKRLIVLVASLLAYGICLAGAWGPGTFDNDDALDWMHLCTESKGSAVIAATLHTAMQPGVLEAPEGAAAIAAAEVVAAAKGKPGGTLPEELRHWLSRQPQQEIATLAPVAKRVLTKVMDPDMSELAQLSSVSPDRQWAQAVAELEARLQ
jgi:hypothetical protein